jgi:hypothetical protein
LWHALVGGAACLIVGLGAGVAVDGLGGHDGPSGGAPGQFRPFPGGAPQGGSGGSQGFGPGSQSGGSTDGSGDGGSTDGSTGGDTGGTAGGATS